MSPVCHIDVYRLVWRTCKICCRACGYVWTGVVRDGLTAREIQCPDCKRTDCANILSVGELSCLPRHMRKQIGKAIAS